METSYRESGQVQADVGNIMEDGLGAAYRVRKSLGYDGRTHYSARVSGLSKAIPLFFHPVLEEGIVVRLS